MRRDCVRQSLVVNVFPNDTVQDTKRAGRQYFVLKIIMWYRLYVIANINTMEILSTEASGDGIAFAPRVQKHIILQSYGFGEFRCCPDSPTELWFFTFRAKYLYEQIHGRVSMFILCRYVSQTPCLCGPMAVPHLLRTCSKFKSEANHPGEPTSKEEEPWCRCSKMTKTTLRIIIKSANGSGGDNILR